MTCILFALSLILGACAGPQIYLIDRQTVMEAEAGGEWPEAEEELLTSGEKLGPTAYARSENKKKNKKLQSILNGELKD